ncbi:MAG: hypothetical protein ACXWLH_05180 [Candidatus Saccharimonadales bacterium]
MGNVVELMQHEDVFEVYELSEMVKGIAERLSDLRENSQERLAEHRQLEEFPEMHAGIIPYPDERQIEPVRPVLSLAPPVEEDPYVLDAPNTRIGRLLIELYGGEDDTEESAGVVAASIDTFEDSSRERQDALANVRKELNAFQRGVYDRDDVEEFLSQVRAELVPGALDWQDILIYVNRAMDKFEPGTRERQEIMTWLYLKTGKRPDGLILPTVGYDEYHRLQVRLDNLLIYGDYDQEDEPEDDSNDDSDELAV